MTWAYEEIGSLEVELQNVEAELKVARRLIAFLDRQLRSVTPVLGNMGWEWPERLPEVDTEAFAMLQRYRAENEF